MIFFFLCQLRGLGTKREATHVRTVHPHTYERRTDYQKIKPLIIGREIKLQTKEETLIVKIEVMNVEKENSNHR